MIKKTLLATLLTTILYFSVVSNSGAVAITYLGGDIVATSKTYKNGVLDKFNTASGFDASGAVVANGLTSAGGGYALSSGAKFNGPTGPNKIRFDLGATATADSASSFINTNTAIATVRSGIDTDGIRNAEDMIHFRLDAGAGESIGDAVKLTMESALDGTLDSDVFFGGFTSVDFEFALYSASDFTTAIMSFNPATATNSRLGTVALPGALGMLMNDTTFTIGDDFFLFFEQTATAEARPAPTLTPFGLLPIGEKASAFATQSTTDLDTLAIYATAAHVAEPKTVALFAIGLFWLGFLVLRNRKYHG